jgi:hypothetical protein
MQAPGANTFQAPSLVLKSISIYVHLTHIMYCYLDKKNIITLVFLNNAYYKYTKIAKNNDPNIDPHMYLRNNIYIKSEYH